MSESRWSYVEFTWWYFRKHSRHFGTIQKPQYNKKMTIKTKRERQRCPPTFAQDKQREFWYILQLKRERRAVSSFTNHTFIEVRQLSPPRPLSPPYPSYITYISLLYHIHHLGLRCWNKLFITALCHLASLVSLIKCLYSLAYMYRLANEHEMKEACC